MSKRIVLRAVLVASVAAACAFGVTACTGGTGSASSASGTAATVNSVEIPESEVTEYVEGIRNQYGLSDESAWGQFLASNNMTPETVREQMIDSFVERELVKAGAKERNLTVDSEEVDGYVTSMRNNYATDEAWENALSQAGFTEEEYRAQIESSLIQQQLRTELENEVTLSDEDILDAAKTYLPYFDGARRSSHILFDASDEEKAKDVLARIKDGSLDFADAAKEYSQDSSADNGGDVGWDVTSSFVSEYQTALSALGEGEVSDLVTSQYGIHIIKCTAVFTAPAEVTSLDQIPEEFLNSITEMAKSIKTSTNYQEWLTAQKDKANIVINDMPANVSYNVDVTKYQTASEDAAEPEASETAAESSAAESASSESTSASASAESASASASSSSAQ